MTLIENKTGDVYSQIYLLSQLSLHHANRQYLVENSIPIKIVNSLRH